jgi:hypothetical protein
MRQAAKASITKRCVRLGIGDLAQIKAQLSGCFLCLLEKSEVEEIVAQRLANEKFGGKIDQTLGSAAPTTLFGVDESVD